jgi:hypothetical protein
MFVSCFSLHRWVSMVHAATPSRCKLLQDSVQARNGTGHRSCTRSGWRKPPLRNVARSQMENAFPRRHSRVQPRAAGVSQPWFGTRTCANRDANQCAKPVAVASPRSEPRRADEIAYLRPDERRASRAAGSALADGKRISTSAFARPTESGWRKPAVVWEPNARSRR